MLHGLRPGRACAGVDGGGGRSGIRVPPRLTGLAGLTRVLRMAGLGGGLGEAVTARGSRGVGRALWRRGAGREAVAGLRGGLFGVAGLGGGLGEAVAGLLGEGCVRGYGRIGLGEAVARCGVCRWRGGRGGAGLPVGLLGLGGGLGEAVADLLRDGCVRRDRRTRGREAVTGGGRGVGCLGGCRLLVGRGCRGRGDGRGGGVRWCGGHGVAGVAGRAGWRRDSGAGRRRSGCCRCTGPTRGTGRGIDRVAPGGRRTLGGLRGERLLLGRRHRLLGLRDRGLLVRQRGMHRRRRRDRWPLRSRGRRRRRGQSVRGRQRRKRTLLRRRRPGGRRLRYAAGGDRSGRGLLGRGRLRRGGLGLHGPRHRTLGLGGAGGAADRLGRNGVMRTGVLRREVLRNGCLRGGALSGHILRCGALSGCLLRGGTLSRCLLRDRDLGHGILLGDRTRLGLAGDDIRTLGTAGRRTLGVTGLSGTGLYGTGLAGSIRTGQPLRAYTAVAALARSALSVLALAGRHHGLGGLGDTAGIHVGTGALRTMRRRLRGRTGCRHVPGARNPGVGARGARRLPTRHLRRVQLEVTGTRRTTGGTPVRARTSSRTRTGGTLCGGAVPDLALHRGSGDPHGRPALDVPVALTTGAGHGRGGRRRPGRRIRTGHTGHVERSAGGRRERQPDRRPHGTGDRRNAPRTGTRTRPRTRVSTSTSTSTRTRFRAGPSRRGVLRVPGRRRVVDGELARHLDGGLRVGLVIVGCGPAPAHPVPIAAHNSSWCGRAPSCRAGATVPVV
ncbi:hypothetical protein SBD_3595 [Streptomyces bottropensis ATCC 25435]|uniref:Uncharacterized protein n=1 Tax=Streptomyces bottropensis ATCC 25435 TaxID=1054862 RepID=M3EXJ6_9ACTN|nr:hypothetical protein SBD_3595 [Streptomyces bottropensis ATCC 25435]